MPVVIANSKKLRDWLKKDGFKKLAVAPVFSFNANVFENAKTEVVRQHPEETDPDLRTAYRLLTRPKPKPKVEPGVTRIELPAFLPKWLKVGFGILVLLLLSVIAARGQTVTFKDEGVTRVRRAGGQVGIDFVGAGVSCAANVAGITTCTISGGGATGYQTIEDEGSALTQRTVLNFIGAGVSCVDSGAPARTDCTISGGGGGSWSDLTDPTAVVVLNSDAVAELFQTRFTAAYGGTDILLDFQQLTGNPVAGSEFMRLTVNDPDMLPFAINDGTNTVFQVERDADITIRNFADQTLNASFDAGASSVQIVNLILGDRSATEWTIQKNAANNFIILDGALARFVLNGAGNAQLTAGAATADILFQSSAFATRVSILGDAPTLCLGTGEDTCLNRSAAGILDVINVVDANTGFRIAGAAAAGNYLRGDATNFVSSAILTADIQELIAFVDLTDIASTTGSGTVGVFATAPTFITSITTPVLISGAADPADAGAIRLGNNECLQWELATPGADGTLCFNASDEFAFNAPIQVSSSGTDQVQLGSGTNLSTWQHTFIEFEGATDNGFETRFSITDPTADRTVTVPNVDTTIHQPFSCTNQFAQSSAAATGLVTCATVDLTADVTGTLPIGNGGTGTPTAFTLGSVVFAGASGVYTQDNANLFWDDTNDRLGIGTAIPGRPLHVVTSFDFVARFESTDSFSAISIRDSNTTAGDQVLIAAVADDMRFRTLNQDRMAISSTGNVGIGTAAPATSALLELSSTTGAFLPTRLTTTQRDALTAVDGMVLYNSTLAQMQGRVGAAWVDLGAGGDGVGYDEVLDEGTGLTKRAQLNFIGGGVSCVDNPGATRTDCTIAGGGTSHEILSGTHTDTTTATVVRGDLMTGQLATPKWQRLAIGGTNLYPKSDGTDIVYSALAAAGVGTCTAEFARALNADAVPTCDPVSLTADVSGILPGASGGTNSAFFQVAGPTVLRTYTFPDSSQTVETQNNKNVASGYAGLDGSTKLTLAQGQEVWALADLTDVTSTTGSGTVSVLATSPTLTTPVISSIVNTGTLTLPTSTDTLVGRATTDTFTNKTLDQEGTGNVVTTVFYIEWQAGSCVGAVATSNFDDSPLLPEPAANCVAGTNITSARLDFDDTADEGMQISFVLPTGWVGNIDFDFDWHGTAIINEVVWALQTICVADGETLDPTFNTAQTVTDTAKGTANQMNRATISNVTTTGCAAGERMFLQPFRDANNGADDFVGDSRLVTARLTGRKTK